jgi:serine/threonine protein kinase
MDAEMSNDTQNAADPNRWLDDEILRRLIKHNPIDARAQQFDKIYVPKEIRGKVSPDRLALILDELRKMRANAGARGSVNLLALRLSASGRPDLFDYILKVGEISVGSAYRAVRLLDFGAESLVFLGEDIRGAPVAIKVPFLDFTNLARLDVDQLLRRRRRLAHEANMLRTLTGTVLPAFIAEQITQNPLFPPRIPPFLRDSEQFLIIEYVNGARVDALARFLLQQKRGCCALRLAAEFATTFFNLSEIITERIGPDAAYTDIKPENALLQDSGMRIVDASSIVINITTEPRSFSVSEVYLDPIDHQHWTAENLVPTPAFIVRSVVRAAHALVANTPLFVAQASPSWPPVALDDFGPTMDGMAADSKIDLRRATDTSNALLNRLVCGHGTGRVCVSELRSPMNARTALTNLDGQSHT